MTIVIKGIKKYTHDVEIRLPDADFTKEAFDHLFGLGRQLCVELKKSFNLTTDLGEDILLISLTELCINEFDEINYQLIHVVYRFLDHEVSLGSLYDQVRYTEEGL